MKKTLKAMLPPPMRRVLRIILEKLNLVDARNFETPDSILCQAYQRIGILNFENDVVSGEAFFLNKILPTLISKPQPVVFDVGANVGDYTKMLLDVLPAAKIHAFEPSAATCATLAKRVSHERVTIIMKGMSNQSGNAEFFDYSDRSSSHASLHAEVLSELHHASSVRRFEVALITLDQYCAEQQLTRVEFIKIDTEGNELAVLQGGQQFIQAGCLPIIQFEFNEMNIVSKSMLKDFYKLLKGYEFFRLMPDGLLPLGEYTSRNEIFAFQNILAVQSKFYPPEMMRPFIVSTLSKPPCIKIKAGRDVEGSNTGRGNL